MKLEQAICDAIPEIENNNFDVIFYELWGNNREGYEVNSAWYGEKDCDKKSILENIRGRWEVFKENYLKSAKIKDLEFDGDEFTIYINCAGIPFVELRRAE